MLPAKEDSVQLSMRHEDGVWYHSLMRLRRAGHDTDIEVLSGSAASMPVIIRPDGKALKAQGELSHQAGAAGIVPDGRFHAIAHCPEST